MSQRDSGKEDQKRAQQVLGFDLDPAPRLSRDAFAVSEANRAALTLIEAWPNWPSAFLNLVGPQGSGKSHLARIWAERAGASLVNLSDLDRVAEGQAAVVDGISELNVQDQLSLFHAYNRLISSGALLLVSETPLSRMVVGTPDLQSRLRAVPVVEISPPDDRLLERLLRKRFDDRQLVVEQAVVDFILSRIDRSFEAAAALVEVLDQEAFKQKRSITIPFARSVMEQMSDDA